MNPWSRRKNEATDRFIARVQRQDVIASIDEAKEALSSRRRKDGMTLLLAAVQRLADPDDPRDIRLRRVLGVSDGPTEDGDDV